MSQPIWKLVYATDNEALYTDETGVYEAEMAVAQTDEDTGITYVYRFPIERPEDPTQEWYSDSLDLVASFVGSSVEDLISGLTCEDPGTRACVYEAIGSYHGFDNFDQYPEEWTEHEFAAWPDRGKLRITISTNDDDDGMVTLYCEDREGAKRAQSILGSHWEAPSDMDTAYASVLDRPDLVEALEAEGYQVDDPYADWSPPTEEDLARWEAKYREEGGR